jgi:hypothetical protein
MRKVCTRIQVQCKSAEAAARKCSLDDDEDDEEDYDEDAEGHQESPMMMRYRCGAACAEKHL